MSNHHTDQSEDESFDEAAFIARFDRFLKRHEDKPPSESPVTKLQALAGLLLLLVAGGVTWGSFKTGTEKDFQAVHKEIEGTHKEIDDMKAPLKEFTDRRAQLDILISRLSK